MSRLSAFSRVTAVYDWQLPHWLFAGLHLALLVPCLKKFRALAPSRPRWLWLPLFLLVPVLGPLLCLGFCHPPPVQPKALQGRRSRTGQIR